MIREVIPKVKKAYKDTNDFLQIIGIQIDV